MRRKAPWTWSAAIALTAAVAAGVLVGCGRPQVSAPVADPDLLARVGDVSVRMADLEREMARVSAGGSPRGADVDRIFAALIERERLVARSRRLGLEQDPEVRRALDGVLIAKLKERELEPRLRAEAPPESPSDLAGASDSARAGVRSQARLAILKIGVSTKSSEARVRQATLRLEEARTRALKLPAGSPGFGDLAAEFSDDDGTRYQGGDLGWLEEDPTKYHLEEAVLSAGFALRTAGDVSPVIRGRDGLYLVRLGGRRNAPAPGSGRSEEVAQYRRRLERQKSIEEAFAAETRELIPVQVDSAALDRFKADHAGKSMADADAGMTSHPMPAR